MRSGRVLVLSLLVVLAMVSTGWAQDPPSVLQFEVGKNYSISTSSNDFGPGPLALTKDWRIFVVNTGTTPLPPTRVDVTPAFPVSWVTRPEEPGTHFTWLLPGAQPNERQSIVIMPVDPTAVVSLGYTASRSADQTWFPAPGYQQLHLRANVQQTVEWVQVIPPFGQGFWHIENDDLFAIVVDAVATATRDSIVIDQKQLGRDGRPFPSSQTLFLQTQLKAGDVVDAYLRFLVVPKRGPVSFTGYAGIHAAVSQVGQRLTATTVTIHAENLEHLKLTATLTVPQPVAIQWWDTTTASASFSSPAGSVANAANVGLDILPGVFPNDIEWNGQGTIPVAILGTPAFSVVTVLPWTIRFGATGTEAEPIAPCTTRDVNGDGAVDLVCEFNKLATGLSASSTTGTLTGTMTDSVTTITGRDAVVALIPPGHITGRVYHDTNGNGVFDLDVDQVQDRVTVWAMDYATGSRVASAVTGSDGMYEIRNLPAGPSFRVAMESDSRNFVAIFYGNTTDWNSAIKVSVSSNQTTTGVDFRVVQGGEIRGTAFYDANGNGVRDEGETAPNPPVLVILQRLSDYSTEGPQSWTDANTGAYVLHGVAPGQSVARAHAHNTPWADEYFRMIDGKPVGTPFAVESQRISMMPNHVVGGIDFSVGLGATVRGTVTANGVGVSGVSVEAFSVPAPGLWALLGVTDKDGAYVIDGLTPGTYHLLSYDPNRLYRDQWWQNSNTEAAGTEVTVNAGETAKADFSLSQIPQGGQIAGMVRADGGGPVLAGIAMEAVTETGQHVMTVNSQADGTYRLTDLPAGRYRLLAYDPTGVYFNEWYDNVAQQDQATLIDLTAASSAAADVSLARASSIAGVITDTSGNPLKDIEVAAQSSTGAGEAGARTDELGHYRVGGLRPGTYILFTNNREGYANELWDNVPLRQSVFEFGNPITVGAAEDVGHKDFQLELGARLTGTVRTAAGQPLSGIQVNLRDATHQWRAGTRTGSDGTYVLSAPAGTFYVIAEVSDPATIPKLNLLDQLYAADPVGGVPCPQANCTYPVSAKLELLAGDRRTGLDLALVEGRTMEGRITDQVTEAPLAGIAMEAVTTEGHHVATVGTQADGTYKVLGLAPGLYRLLAYDPTGVYVNEWFNEQFIQNQGQTIDLAAAPAFFGNMSLAKGGRISGTVTEAGTSPAVGIQSQVWIYQGTTLVADTRSDAQTGAYVSPALPPGTYTVRTLSDYGAHTYVDQWAYGKSCTPNCEAVTGDSVTISAGETTTLGFSLARRPIVGQITGRIYDASTNSGLAGASVVVTPIAGGNPVGISSTTNSSGNFTVTDIPPGSYYVKTTNTGSYVGLLYQNVPCPNGQCLSAGSPVTVNANSTTGGIDFRMQYGVGWMTGTVTNASGAAIANVDIGIVNGSGSSVANGRTGADGRYLVSLSPGTYYANTNNRLGYVNKIWNNRPLKQPLTSGDPISVVAGQARTSVDFQLDTGGSLIGTTRVNGQPLGSIQVNVYDVAGQWVGGTMSLSDGLYILPVPAGTYYVYAQPGGNGNYVDQMYVPTPIGGIPCPQRSCALTENAKITVAVGEQRTGLDLSLIVGGRIAGSVTVAGGAPAVGIMSQVWVYQGSIRVSDTRSDATTGAFVSQLLAPGTYTVRTMSTYSGVTTYEDQLYNGKSCLSSCVVTTGDPVTVASNLSTTINFELRKYGQITGQVKNEAGVVLANIGMKIYTTAGTAVSSSVNIRTDSAGIYVTPLLPAGSYLIRTSATPFYLDEVYNDIPCPGGYCANTTGTSLTVGWGEVRSGIDFTLSSAPVITGTVTKAADGQPISPVTVEVVNSYGSLVSSTQTNAAGAYISAGLAPGRYFVRTTASMAFVDQLYAGMMCVGSTCTPSAGTPLILDGTQSVSGINFALQSAGSITGTVYGTGNAKLGGVTVRAYTSPGGTQVKSVNTPTSGTAVGTFTLSGLPPGNYVIATTNAYNQGYIDQTNDGQPCAAGACAFATVPPVAVVGDAPNTLDFRLTAGGSITGTITAGNGSVTVNAYDRFGISQVATATVTSTTGTPAAVFTLRGLPAGSYYVTTSNSRGYIDQLYDQVACPNRSCTPATGRLVTVSTGQATQGIDIVLNFGKSLTGKVTATDGSALANVTVRASDAYGRNLGSGITSADGAYSIGGLSAGTYYLRTSNSQGYVDQIYDQQVSIFVANPAAVGTPIVVGPNDLAVTTNFVLSKGGRISGMVTDEGTGTPLRSVTIQISSGSGVAGTVSTDAAGQYLSPAFPSGQYSVRTSNAQGFANQAYKDLPYTGIGSEGAPVPVTAPSTTAGINFSLMAGGRITGKVTSASGTSLEGVRLTAFYADGMTQAATASTDLTGAYVLTGLSTGTYYVRTGNKLGYIDQVSGGKPCLNCDIRTGEPAAVTLGSTTGGINFALNLAQVALNDSCSNATDITTTPYAEAVSTLQTTTSSSDPIQSCGYGLPAKTVWYRFTPVFDGTLTVQGLGSGYDTVVSVTSGTCGSVAELPNACSDDTYYSARGYTAANSLTNGLVSVGVTANTTYLIQVAALNNDGGTLVFSLSFEPSNREPVANAGSDQTVEATSAAGAIVALDGTASTDPDSNPLTYAWSGPFGTATGATPSVALSLGTHVITLTVSDGQGGSSADTVSVTVRDTTPPVLHLPASVSVDATSPSGATVIYATTAVDLVDGVVPATCAPGSGRVIALGMTTVTCTATDTHGNTVTGSFPVTVRGAESQLADLAVVVAGVGPGGSLANKVANAQAEVAAGNYQAARNTLKAVVNETRAQSGKKLTVEQANTIIAAANQISAVIGG